MCPVSFLSPQRFGRSCSPDYVAVLRVGDLCPVFVSEVPKSHVGVRSRVLLDFFFPLTCGAYLVDLRPFDGG